MKSGKKSRFIHWGKFCIFVLLFIFISGTGHTQSKYPYWSLSALGGATIPVGNFSEVYDVGGNVGGDVAFHIVPSWSVVGNVTYNFLKEKISGSILDESSYLEVTIGVRRYYVLKSVKAFGETEIGLYRYHVGGSTTTSTLTENDFGLNVGAGIEIPLSNAVDITGKLKYHAILNSGSTAYLGFYGGINVHISK